MRVRPADPPRNGEDHLITLTLPPRTEEAWRWFDRDALGRAAEGASASAPIEPDWLAVPGPRLLFRDGVFDAAASDPGPVTIEPLALGTDHPLARQAQGAGWSLRLASDAATDLVQIAYLTSGGTAHAPALVTLADDAVAAIHEIHLGSGGWTNRLTQFRLGRAARLMRTVAIGHDAGFVALRDEAELGEGASFVSTAIATGSSSTRIDAALTLNGDAGFAEYGGALLTRDAERKEAAVVVRHAAPGGQSRQVWRAVAHDRSVASLAARVEVARHAQQTDGVQSLRGLLIDRTATINLKPELEIFADDVKCAHGATVGALDERALFYLQSRGVPPARAEALLTHAFVADAIERVGNEDARAKLMAQADAWLAA